MRVEQPRSAELSSSVHHHRPARGIDVASGGRGELRPWVRAADERHPPAQQECHRLNQDRRLSRSGGLATSRPTSGLAGRRPELGRYEGFGTHPRRLGSSSTAAKRCSQAQGDVACGVQCVGAPMDRAPMDQARTPRSVAAISQADVLAGGCGSPHDPNSAGGRNGGRHVAVDPGEHLGEETKARAYGYAAGGWRNAEVKGSCRRPSSLGVDWNGDLGHDTFPHRGRFAGGPASSHPPSGQARSAARARRGACVRSTGKQIFVGMSLVPLGYGAGRGARHQGRLLSRAERSTALTLAPLLGLSRAWLRGAKLPGLTAPSFTTAPGCAGRGRGPGFAERSHRHVVARVRLDRSPQQTMTRRELASAGSRRMVRGHLSNYFQARR